MTYIVLVLLFLAFLYALEIKRHKEEFLRYEELTGEVDEAAQALLETGMTARDAQIAREQVHKTLMLVYAAGERTDAGNSQPG